MKVTKNTGKETKLEKDIARLLRLLDLKDDFKKKLKDEIKREVYLDVLAALRSDLRLSVLDDKLKVLKDVNYQ